MENKLDLMPGFVAEIRQLLLEARQTVLRHVNSLMVKTYFEIGKRIVEQEQQGNEQAGYGTYLLETLSVELSKEFGKGFSKRNLELIRKFYLCYRNAKSPISRIISRLSIIQSDFCQSLSYNFTK